MAEYSAIAVQIVNPGEDVVFTETRVGCNRGLVRHRDGTSGFLLSGATRCRCQRCADYVIDFGANISIPTGGTVGPITLAIAVDGSVDPASPMEITPAAVDQYFEVSRELDIPIWSGCCQNISIRNTSDQPIQVKQATIDITRPDIR